MNDTHQAQLQTLQDIRSLMERSSRFISLSGLSGVVAGTWALVGAGVAYWYLGMTPFGAERFYYYDAIGQSRWGMSYTAFFLLDAGLVLVLALSSGIYFTTRRAKQKGQRIWGPLSRRLLLNLAIPLAAGGVFCLALLYNGYLALVAPATLIFYGLSLVNASRDTLPDIRHLGLMEVGLGLLSCFMLGHGLTFWAIGFGLLHIGYGIYMYLKYERAV